MPMTCSPSPHRRPSLAELVAEPEYIGRVAALAGGLQSAATGHEALSVLADSVDAMGIDAAAFFSFVKDDETHESFRVLLACDPSWCIEYEHRAWYATDPWLNYAMGHSEPVRADQIPLEGREAHDIVALAERYGFKSALIVPAPASGLVTRLGVLCLGSETPGFFADAGYPTFKLVARGLAMELHGWWVDRIKQEVIEQAKLSVEDLMLLAEEYRGSCTKTMADRLSMSPHAINSRFQRMNSRLGVPNRRAAARLAAEYGMI